MSENRKPAIGFRVERTEHHSRGIAAKAVKQGRIRSGRQSPDEGAGTSLAHRQRIATARKCEELAVKLADIAAEISGTLREHPGIANATGQVRFATEFLWENAHLLAADDKRKA